MFDIIAPRGASELVIESPRHDDTLATMDPEHLESVLWMFRDRILDLKRDDQIRDILISRHHRKPGVAAHHPYSRVSAMPIVFDATRRELREAREYYQYKRRCLYCDMLRQEMGSAERVVRLTPVLSSPSSPTPRAAPGDMDPAPAAWLLLRGGPGPRRWWAIWPALPRGCSGRSRWAWAIPATSSSCTMPRMCGRG